MIRKRIRAALGEIALYHSANGNPEKALRYVQKMEIIGEVRPFQRAYKSTLLLILHRFSEAEDIFCEVSISTEHSVDLDDVYTYLYCQSMINNIRGNLLEMNKYI